jgi:hypothetical protein
MVGGRKACSPTLAEVEEMADQESSAPHAVSFVTALATDAFELISITSDGGNDVRIFDWDCWRVDVAADDLAYMLALHWYPDRRRRMEQPLLDCYHSALLKSGANSRAEITN